MTAAVPPPVAPPPAPLVVVYEERAAAARLFAGIGRAARPGAISAVRQGPAGAIGWEPGQAGKVTSHDGTASSPRLPGLGAAAMADALRAQIAASGAHMVFVDELSSDFRGTDGDALDEALTLLSAEPSPYGGESLARRVHVYVPSPGWLLQDPSGWRAAFSALARSGGVWLEAFRARRGVPQPWTDDEWATWPEAFQRLFVAAGGDPTRLHLLIGGRGVSRSFARARVGTACRMLANGPGSYRTGREAAVFAQELVADFGDEGERRPTCLPPSRLPPAQRPRAAAVLSLSGGADVDGDVVSTPRGVVEQTPSPLIVRLGRDPLGLASTLGLRPRDLWRHGRPQLRITGAGVALTRKLRPGATVRLLIHPRVPGPLLVELLVDGDAVRRWSGPVDLVSSLSPWRPRLRAISDRLVAAPSTWDLVIPLRRGGSTRTATLLVAAATGG